MYKKNINYAKFKSGQQDKTYTIRNVIKLSLTPFIW